MNKSELVGFLRSENELSKLPYWNALLNAALSLGEEDFESGANAKYPGELRNFVFTLGKFIEANVLEYATPESTLTG